MKRRLAGGALVVWILVGACGGSPKPADDPETSKVVTEPDVAPPPMPPDAKLDETRCTEAVQHAIALMEANEDAKAFVPQMQENSPQLVKDCMETATQADYDCLMAARTFDELGTCEDPGADAK